MSLKKNKKYLLISLFIILLIFIQILIYIGVDYVIPKYLTDESYRLLLKEYGETPLDILVSNFQVTNIGNHIIFSTGIFQIIITFLAGLGGLSFYKKFRSIEKMKYYRYKSMRESFYRDCLIEALKWAAAVFVGYFIVYTILCIICDVPEVDYSQIPRTLFLDILGKDFYFNHHRLYWLLEGLIRFFWVPFTYAFFTATLSLTAFNSSIVYLIPNLYYIIMTAFSAIVFNGLLKSSIGNILNPSVLMASSSYELSTISLLLPSLIPILLGCIVIEYYLKKDVL